jgi:hypothetical protein
MLETSSSSPETDPRNEITLAMAARNPQEGDTIFVNPGTENEIKYEITFVGQKLKPVMQYDKDGQYIGTDLTTLDIVEFKYTLCGITERYTRTREHYYGKVRRLANNIDIVKCYQRP